VTQEPRLHCARCDLDHPLPELAWRCARCSGVLDLAGFDPAWPDPSAWAARPATLWRYAEALPVPAGRAARISLGEGMTPLVPAAGHPGVALKVDYLAPTGSFKDRGAVVLVAAAAELGACRMVADSSGNAGAAIAAYAARAGIGCEVFLPAGTSPGKVAQLRAYRAEVREVAGTRQDAADAAALAAEAPGVYYASHVYQPAFLHGTKTYAFELWEQLGGRLPETLLLPVGNGTLVLGAYLGARELAARGLVDRLPRIVAVQAAGCAPLAAAFAAGRDEPEPVTPEPTVAEGIAIARPARGAQILAAVRDTGGAVVTVSDGQVLEARAELGAGGLYVEPTAAACWAAVRSGAVPPVPSPESPAPSGAPSEARGRSHGDVPVHTVLPLCGSGLKSGGY
jgi:threonine synthase